jgi:hypothetical protein
VGIVTIGLLDLAFSTYLRHQELMKQLTNLSVEVQSTEPDSLATISLSTPDNPDTSTAMEVSSPNSGAASRPDKPFHFLANRHSSAQLGTYPRTAFAKWNLPIASCRTVSYSLINDSYVVRVTDDLGCLTTTLSKNQ